ncbi:magnesium chelatase family protein [Limimonas halophila]|uniref:Magnesium chelatase family protein n=1 Tax=Limimonas halophila TaxID=1082479 RepID=A0A1G7SSN7_9PROT|nr:magnesium chelatase family protein [Limimonas halophila]
MVARVATVAFRGIEAVDVEVQVQMSQGLPAFQIVGLPNKAVDESKERVRAALGALGLSLPPKRITVNLAPADLAKEGSHFDLPIALAVLVAMEAVPAEDARTYLALGELGLDGRLADVAGALPAAIHANGRDLGLICPANQGPEAAWAGEDVEVLAPDSLIALVNHFKGSQILTPPAAQVATADGRAPDLADIKGQETAKRALEIAAAGGHNMLMIGPPGAGKSMLAARMPGLMPPLDAREALEVSMVHSVAGGLPDGKLISQRPYRDPHHSASLPSLTGGGVNYISSCDKTSVNATRVPSKREGGTKAGPAAYPCHARSSCTPPGARLDWRGGVAHRLAARCPRAAGAGRAGFVL